MGRGRETLKMMLFAQSSNVPSCNLPSYPSLLLLLGPCWPSPLKLGSWTTGLAGPFLLDQFILPAMAELVPLLMDALCEMSEKNREFAEKSKVGGGGQAMGGPPQVPSGTSPPRTPTPFQALGCPDIGKSWAICIFFCPKIK